MHLYAFGSVCRGEVDRGSDIDLLACIGDEKPDIDPNTYSIYKYQRLIDLWSEGNPFAWHLHLESKLLFTPNGEDFIKTLGKPSTYKAVEVDLDKFKTLFSDSYHAIQNSKNSATFHLSCIFLAIRNFATCYSLSIGKPVFSRNSPLLVDPKLNINPEVFSILSRARILSTRGYGKAIDPEEIQYVENEIRIIPDWMDEIISRRLQ